jgi:predicted nucleic-acid-binding protein
MKKQTKTLPDTNIIIRYLVKDDAAQYALAKEFFDNVRSGKKKAVILESVIAECIYILVKIYKVPKDMAAESLTDILHYKGIANPDQSELISALKIFTERNIDIVDCILCAKASEEDTFLFSFDKELNKVSDSLRLT